MYFNKTHCSTTFDPSSVDLKLLTPLTLGSDSGGHRSCAFPGALRQRRKCVYTPVRARIRHFQSMLRQGLLIVLIIPSFISFFSLSLLCPSINVRKRSQTSAKSTHVSFCMSAHYIILSSPQAPRRPSYGQSL